MREELTASSNIYKSNNEGKAIWIKIIAGIIVQTHSIICLSNKVILINLFTTILYIMWPTKVIIKSKIRLI